MEQTDVLIVGGGPAGSSCAWALRGSGLDVAVMDRCDFPRDKTCAGWITPPVLDLLQIDVSDYASTRTLQPITGFRTGLLGGTEIETRYDEVVSFGIRRCEFDDYLLSRCGARLLTGQPVRHIERARDQWVINGDVRAPMLVGAGGHFCPVSRMIGTPAGEKPLLVTAQEIEFRPDVDDLSRSSVRAETPELYFCSDLSGYAWCFRKGSYLNIGLGQTASHALKDGIHRLREYLQRQGKVSGEIPPNMHGHAYWLYGGGRRAVVQDGVLLIGDAAGLADARSGEGIRPAIESGIMAGRLLMQCKGDYRSSRLEAYADWLTARFGPIRSNGLGSVLTNRLRPVVGRVLLKSRRFSRRVLLDQWFLHRGPADSAVPVSRVDV